MDAFVFRAGRGIAAQLQEIGVDPGRVDHLALSHLHNDHVGNVDLFPRSAVLVQRAERDAAYGPGAESYYYERDTYSALDQERIQPLDGDHDVFGDGTVVLESWPGHTRGLPVTPASPTLVQIGRVRGCPQNVRNGPSTMGR